MQTYWKVTNTTLKAPVLRRRSGLRQRSANVVEEFLHQQSPFRRTRTQSPWQRRSVGGAQLKRETSLQGNVDVSSLSRSRGAKSVDAIRVKEGDTLRSEMPSIHLCPPVTKHRYFVLSDSTQIYDLKAKALKKVSIIQDVDEVEQLAAPSQSPERVIQKMQMHLDVRLAQLREDQQKMQIATLLPPTTLQDAPTAFKALKTGDSDTVMMMVASDASLLEAIDSVLLIQTEQTLLHWACKRRMEYLAKYLIDKGADMNKKDLGGRSAKDIARKKGLISVVSYMIKVKPTFNPKMNSAIFMRKAARKMTEKVRTRKGRTLSRL